jgi:hypothetical protein
MATKDVKRSLSISSGTTKLMSLDTEIPTRVVVTRREAIADSPSGATIIREQNAYEPTETSLERLEEVLGIPYAHSRPKNVLVTGALFQGWITMRVNVEGNLE